MTTDTGNVYVLYRIVGNDLYPRHRRGQQYENLRFILENEPELPGCDKRFVVNRIIDGKQRSRVLELLQDAGVDYFEIPFEADAYAGAYCDTSNMPSGYLASGEFESIPAHEYSHAYVSAYRHKNRYVMNNNGARNAALSHGLESGYRYVMPWDGNSFVTRLAWMEIVDNMSVAPDAKYGIVYMSREMDNEKILRPGYRPVAEEEPQVLFRDDALESFDERYWYGRRPKVELLWRLGVPGKWDRWKIEPWDHRKNTYSPDKGQFTLAGWTSRLYSGVGNLETAGKLTLRHRGHARNEAIISALDHIDSNLWKRLSPTELRFYSREKLVHEHLRYRQGTAGEDLVGVIKKVIDGAKEALTRGPYSVVDKTELPPSRDPHDYWHLAPYAWPNPATPDGLPYISRDGVRAPGTYLYEPEAERYDRTRTQRVFDDGLTLSFAWWFTGDTRYSDYAAEILRVFFVDKETRLNPNLTYAQVFPGRYGSEGRGYGIIEFKDLYYYLDAVRLMHESGSLRGQVLDGFREWLTKYLEWLLTSPQGSSERKSKNNHGTFYDLQVGAIAAFLGADEVLAEALLRAQSRILKQIAIDGVQPDELARPISQHYVHFNLQAWLMVGQLGADRDVPLWNYGNEAGGPRLLKALEWVLECAQKPWDYQQIGEFDNQRTEYLAMSVRSEYLQKRGLVDTTSAYKVKPVFYPHDGIRPFWNLGLVPLNVRVDGLGPRGD